MRFSSEILTPVIEIGVYAVVLWRYLGEKGHRGLFDYGIEALVYVMPVAIVIGLVRRRLAARATRTDEVDT
jgi:ABC-type uncharacterized transport system fused permease/ATPase subunit